MSSTLDETTALRPLCDSNLHLMITNWAEEAESVFQYKKPRHEVDWNAPDQLWWVLGNSS